jgi:hypothetical protein
MYIRIVQEREVRAVFSFLNKLDSGELVYDDIMWGTELLARRACKSTTGITADQLEQAFKIADTVWSTLDHFKVALATYICMHDLLSNDLAACISTALN